LTVQGTSLPGFDDDTVAAFPTFTAEKIMLPETHTLHQGVAVE